MITLAQHETAMKRYNQRARRKTGTVAVSLATLRKSWCGSAAPVYEALYADGTRLRFTIFQMPDKPYDFARGRAVARRAYSGRLVNGWLHHSIPGKDAVTLHDDLEPVKAKNRVSYKALLQSLIDATKQDDVTALERAWNAANQALAA